MKVTLRRFASVKPSSSGRYLEAGNPTGLTGLFTHPAPRSTLLYVYGSTLDKLQKLPSHSVYRQSTEALTKHRMKIIESIKPAGYEEWAKRAAEKVDKNPELFAPGKSNNTYGEAGGHSFVETQTQEENEDREWDGEKNSPTLEGPRDIAEGDRNARMRQIRRPDDGKKIQWEAEPPLEISQ